MSRMLRLEKMKITKARWISYPLGFCCVDPSVNLRNFNLLCILIGEHLSS